MDTKMMYRVSRMVWDFFEEDGILSAYVTMYGKRLLVAVFHFDSAVCRLLACGRNVLVTFNTEVVKNLLIARILPGWIKDKMSTYCMVYV